MTDNVLKTVCLRENY